MSRMNWMRKFAGVMAVTLTMSFGAICASAQSTTTTSNNAAAPAETGAVLGVSRTENGADVAPGVTVDEPGVLGANRDRSPRTADNGYETLALMAIASLAGAGALAYGTRRRA